jgi:hypothetical protein
MTLPRCAAEVLTSHVLFEVEAIDRMNLYQPRLQHGAGIAAFFVGHRGFPFASSALMAPMTRSFAADIEHFVAARGLDLVRFARGQRKDDVTHEYLRRAERDERGLVPAQVLYVGVAQEKQKVFRTVKRRNPVTGKAYPWLVPSTAVVNQYYFYCVDEESGPVCLKVSGYFPYTGRLILNGNDYAQRQAAKAGIGFEPLDNAFAAVDDVAAVQAICDGLDERKIEDLASRLLALLPHPFTAADTEAGYRYELSVLQAEFSLTQVLDKPVSGRVFFDQLIRDNLGIGRPDRVSLIFGRRIQGGRKRPTPGRFRTEPAHRLQELQDQAVPQARPGTPDRDHDQRHPRLRRGQRAVSSPAAEGDRLYRQQAPAPGTTDQPRPRRGNCRPHSPHQPCHQPGRHPHRRDAPYQHARAGPARRPVRFPAPARRLH